MRRPAGLMTIKNHSALVTTHWSLNSWTIEEYITIVAVIESMGFTHSLTRAQFHDSAESAYCKHRIDAYGSREFGAYGKRISQASSSSEFWLLRVPTPLY